MRKLSLLFFVAVSLNISLHAQSDTAFALVRYTFTHIDDTTQPDNPNKENMVLYLGKDLSLYTNYDKMMQISKGGTQSARSSDGTIVVSGGRMGGPPPPPLSPLVATAGNYYKDLNSSKTASMEFAGGKIFSVEDKIPVIDWAITQETKDIMGMQCQKATGYFKGRVYTAWFNTLLPYNNGPWKLGGLPGLILEAYDTKKEVVFTLVAYENASGTRTVMEISKEALKTTPKEMQQYTAALQRDRDAAMGSNGGSLGRITAMTVGLDGRPVKQKQRNNPIEKSSN